MYTSLIPWHRHYLTLPCTFHLPNLMSFFHSLGCTKRSIQSRIKCELFVIWQYFYGEDLLTPCPNPKLEGYPLSSVSNCVFNIFATTPCIRRAFLHLQPVDAPCRCVWDPQTPALQRAVPFVLFLAQH